MTDHDGDLALTRAVRRHARHDEPPFTIAAERVVGAGRRRVRSHRISLALRGAVAVGVLAALAASPAPAEGHGPVAAVVVVR